MLVQKVLLCGKCDYDKDPAMTGCTVMVSYPTAL